MLSFIQLIHTAANVYQLKYRSGSSGSFHKEYSDIFFLVILDKSVKRVYIFSNA